MHDRTAAALALAGVAVFAGTYPATRLAMAGGVSPMFNCSARIVGAGLLAALVLAVLRAPRPCWREVPGLFAVGLGVGVAFPLCLGYALQSVPASHGAVVMAALPLATTLYAGIRGHRLPGRRFWFAGAVAGALVIAFSLRRSQLHDASAADLLLLLAMVGAAVGYVEGARLTTPERPAWQVISWALVLLAPLMLPLALLSHGGLSFTPAAWAGLAYGTLFSMYLGFFPWYAAMRRAGIARTSQWQYLQPFLAIAYAVLLLDERIDAIDGLLVASVIACIWWSRRESTAAR